MKKKAKKPSYITKVHADPYKPYWVCNLCYPTMIELGHIWGIGWLVYNRSDETGEENYAILKGQGHRDDETIVFEEKPHRMEGDFSDTIIPYDFQMKFYDAINAFEAIKSLVGIKKFQDKNGPGILAGEVSHWITLQCVNIIAKWEKKFGNVEKFYKKFHVKRLKQREEYYKQQQINRVLAELSKD
jgi:hypothetical protein